MVIFAQLVTAYEIIKLNRSKWSVFESVAFKKKVNVTSQLSCQASHCSWPWVAFLRQTKTELVPTRTWHVFTEVKVFQEKATLWTTPNRRTSIQLADRLRWTAGHVGDPRVSPGLAVGVAAMAGVTRFPVSMATPAVL